MGKFRCVCNYIIKVSGDIPNPIEWLLIPDSKFINEYFEEELDMQQVYQETKSMFRCPRCDRLWIYWNGIDEMPECYAPQRLLDELDPDEAKEAVPETE